MLRLIEAQLHSKKLVDQICFEPLYYFYFVLEQRRAWQCAATRWNIIASVLNTDKWSKVTQVRIYSEMQHRNCESGFAVKSLHHIQPTDKSKTVEIPYGLTEKK